MIEICTNCDRKIGRFEQAYVFDERVLCEQCYGKLRDIQQNKVPKTSENKFPRCPFCNAALKNRKTPKRRSSFGCPSCHETIFVDPYQYIYPSVYLTDEQNGYVGFLWQLDHWVFTKGSYKDYQQMKNELTGRFGQKPDVRDIIWGLMNLSLTECIDKGEKDRRLFIAQGFSSKEADELKDNLFVEEIQNLMEEFREFEKQVKSNRK
jgi:hypothetical protein